MAAAQRLDGSGTLCVSDLLIALLKRVSLQSLPRQRASQEVHKHVTESFQVIATGLLLAQVGVDGHVTRCSGERLMLSIRNVFVCLEFDIFLCKAKVDDVNYLLTAGTVAANKEVFRLNITVNQMAVVDVFDPVELEVR